MTPRREIMKTAMAVAPRLLPTERGGKKHRRRNGPIQAYSLSGNDDKAGIDASERERIGHRRTDREFACDIRYRIEVAFRIGPEPINGRRGNVVAHRHDGDDEFDRAGG